jgi:hypothetical protein
MTELLHQDRKSKLPAEKLKLSPGWVDGLTKFAERTEKMAFSDPTQSAYPNYYNAKDPYHTTGQMPTQLIVLSLLPHKEEEEEVFIEKADFDEDILSAAAKMNCSGEETETDGCILAYRDADGNRVNTTQTDYSEVIEIPSVLFNGKKYIDSFKHKPSLESHMGHSCDNCMTYSAIEDILIGLCTNCAYTLAEANNQSHGLYKCDLYEDDNLIIPPYVTELEKHIIISYCTDNPFESRQPPSLIPLDKSYIEHA